LKWLQINQNALPYLSTIQFYLIIRIIHRKCKQFIITCIHKKSEKAVYVVIKNILFGIINKVIVEHFVN